MATAQFTNDSLNQMTAHFQGLGNRAERVMTKLVEETINDGAALMRSNIEASGRIDQGYMLGDVAASEVSATKTQASGSFGWGVTAGPVAPYYLYQEYGFKHWRSGKMIPPMHALLEAFTTEQEKFQARALEAVA